VRILVADHSGVRELVEDTLEPAFEVIGTVDNGEALVKTASKVSDIAEDRTSGCSCLTFLLLTEIPYRKEMTFRNPSCTTVRKSVILRGVKRGGEVFRNQMLLERDRRTKYWRVTLRRWVWTWANSDHQPSGGCGPSGCRRPHSHVRMLSSEIVPPRLFAWK
jgi:hypothetical protein